MLENWNAEVCNAYYINITQITVLDQNRDSKNVHDDMMADESYTML